MAIGALVDRTDEGIEPLWQPVVERVFENAAKFPDMPAVRARGVTLSYAELVAQIKTFSSRISRRISPADPIVALCLDRTVDLPAWLLATHAVGAAYLPLDPGLPQARISQMLDDAAPELIIVSRCFLPALPKTDVITLVAEDDEPRYDVRRPDVQPAMRAYVIYTSGSTGRPKGVEIEHASLTALMETMQHTPGLKNGETMLGLTRISFDLSVGEMFLPFFVGGTLILADLDVAADPVLLGETLEHSRPDLVSATPSTWRALIEAGWKGRPDLRLTTGGEAITRELADRLLVRSKEVWNMYGPTEATVWATASRITSGTGPVSIGVPMSGVTVRILDSAFADAAVGSVGEIAISGHGVRRGYLNRPELSSQRFITLDDDKLTYLTGDLGMFDETGALYCLGRSDDQVKIRGFRIELGDVEAALLGHKDIAFCSVRVWPDPSGDPTLVAYVVRRSGACETVPSIRAFLASLLPSYMIPGRFEFIAHLPLTPNGKTDRAALLDPFNSTTRLGLDKSFNSVEAQLAVIWSDLLGISQILPGDDFFDLGGYSLMTVRLLRRIEVEFGQGLSLSDLMRQSTLSQMAQLIRSGRGTHSSETMLLNAVGSRPAFYWLDAGPLMRTMARTMSPQQPAYALNLTPADEAALDGNPVDIVAVAATLRKRLVEAQHVGPYYIGGWCRWGIVAYELASQLRADGHLVGLLVLLDAERPGNPDLITRLRSGVRSWLGKDQTIDNCEPKTFSQKVEAASRVFALGSLEADVLLVRPSSRADDGRWARSVIGNLQVAYTPGDHVSMVRAPHVSALGNLIDQHLLTAQCSRLHLADAPA